MEKPRITTTFNMYNFKEVTISFPYLGKSYTLSDNWLLENIHKLQPIHDKYFKLDMDVEYNKELKELLNEKPN